MDNSTLDLELQDFLASTSNIKADSAKRRRALNRGLDRMQLKGNWIFTVRKKTFDYIPSIEDYNTRTYIQTLDNDSVNDFKHFYQVLNKDLPIVDARRFGRDSVAQRIKDKDHYLSVNLNEGIVKTIDGLNGLTSDGTWSAQDDATTLVKDTAEYKKGTSSLKFDIDVSNSVNNYATIGNTTKTSQDLTNLEDRSYFTVWVYLPTTSITSVELQWGSDASNYWYKQETSPIDSESMQTGWNLFVFAWSDATQTGSPDVTAIDSYKLRLNYAASLTDQSSVRFNYLTLEERTQLDLEYFSSCMVKNSSGNYISRFTTGTDEFLGPDELKPLLVELGFNELLRKTKVTNKGEITDSDSRIREMLDNAFDIYGYTTRFQGTKHPRTKLI